MVVSFRTMIGLRWLPNVLKATMLPLGTSMDPGQTVARAGKSASGTVAKVLISLKGKDKDKDTDTETAPNKVKTDHLAAWKYLEPKDLTMLLVGEENRNWKFCTKCVCKKSGKTGF